MARVSHVDGSAAQEMLIGVTFQVSPFTPLMTPMLSTPFFIDAFRRAFAIDARCYLFTPRYLA